MYSQTHAQEALATQLAARAFRAQSTSSTQTKLLQKNIGCNMQTLPSLCTASMPKNTELTVHLPFKLKKLFALKAML